jgi:hypothetical protein
VALDAIHVAVFPSDQQEARPGTRGDQSRGGGHVPVMKIAVQNGIVLPQRSGAGVERYDGVGVEIGTGTKLRQKIRCGIAGRDIHRSAGSIQGV